MLAIAAVIAFAVAFILHAFAHGQGKIVTDAVILGLLFLAAHQLWAYYPWRARA